MPEPGPTERIQPCLLDRLTDDEPEKKHESRNARVISPSRYRDAYPHLGTLIQSENALR